METILRNTKPTAKQMYLDPRTKIFLCLTVSFVTFAAPTTGIMSYLLPCLAIFPLIAFIILKKPLLAVYYLLLYVISLTIPPLIAPYAPPIINLLFTGMIAVSTKILPGMSMFAFLILTTTVSEFVTAMHKLRIPKKITIPISVIFRFIPTIKEEYFAIRDAMKLRGVGSLRNPIQMLEYRMVPLLTGLVIIGNELSASALTRGFDSPIIRTNVCPVGFHLQDILAFSFSIVILLLFALCSVFGW